MARESFLLVSLKEDKAKKLAQVVSNESCRKILDYLAEKDATEAELAEKLNIPISTVHYNLQHLVNSGLVTVEEFHYSEKGREVNHYKLANKYIIITPKSTFGIKEKLRSILPVILIVVGFAGLIQLFSSFFTKEIPLATMGTMKAEILEKAVMEAAPAAEEAVAETAPGAIQPVSQLLQINPALWFLIGAVFTLLLIIFIEYMKNKKSNK